jgi:hypothetical protein
MMVIHTCLDDFVDMAMTVRLGLDVSGNGVKSLQTIDFDANPVGPIFITLVGGEEQSRLCLQLAAAQLPKVLDEQALSTQLVDH